MEIKFKNKYRIETNRAQFWDYGNEGSYFITIKTKNGEHFFGEINCIPEKDTSTMIYRLNATEIGKIAEREWLKTPAIRHDMNLILDEFVLMPNHFHAIIHIGENVFNQNNLTFKEINCNRKQWENHVFGPQSNNLSAICRGYKAAVTRYAREKKIEFNWQPRFHDHIIRSEEEYYSIKNYISNNPQNWFQDSKHKIKSLS